MAATRGKEVRSVLDQLEKAYGPLVEPQDAVEAGILATLAQFAPEHANEPIRDRLRSAFADWNEVRVADPWDVTIAMETAGDPSARTFARALLRYLESLHGTLNRCTFDVPPGEAKPDWPVLLEKVRGATPGAKAVILAMLDVDQGGWHVTPDMAKVIQKLALTGKTTSAAKMAAELKDNCDPSDRLRAHYLLARYGARAKEDPDPLDGKSAKKHSAATPAKSGGEKAAPAKGAKKPAAAKGKE